MLYKFYADLWLADEQCWLFRFPVIAPDYVTAWKIYKQIVIAHGTLDNREGFKTSIKLFETLTEVRNATR